MGAQQVARVEPGLQLRLGESRHPLAQRPAGRPEVLGLDRGEPPHDRDRVGGRGVREAELEQPQVHEVVDVHRIVILGTGPTTGRGAGVRNNHRGGVSTRRGQP
jgi:hypothetical protein